mmetsp:Transcript_109805/g.297767  ORF Transcript_109805/g.297767 Transcript_109805/m.297767 type:complete len:209 (+) Transcript_109805:265-891(+)
MLPLIGLCSFPLHALSRRSRSPRPLFSARRSFCRGAPSSQALTAARPRRSARLTGSTTLDRHRLAVSTAALDSEMRWPPLTTHSRWLSLGRNIAANSAPARQPSGYCNGVHPPGASSDARACAACALMPPMCRTSFATPTVTMFARTPRCVAAPQPRGWKAPFPSTKTTCGLHCLGSSCRSARKAGTSLKAEKPVTYGTERRNSAQRS